MATGNDDAFPDVNKAMALLKPLLAQADAEDWPDGVWAPDQLPDVALARLGKPLVKWLQGAGLDAFYGWFRTVEHTWFCTAECADDSDVQFCSDWIELHGMAVEDVKTAMGELAKLVLERREELADARDAVAMALR